TSGSTGYFEAPSDSFTVSLGASAVSISAVKAAPGSGSASLSLSAPSGSELAVGAFESARRQPFAGTAPGIEFSGMGCNTVTGRFSVLELVYDSNFQIVSFAADFEHHCE